VVTILSQQLASHGLHFFKVHKTVTHVSVARPHFLDLESTPVSEGLRKIVEFIRAHEGCTRKQVMDAVAPTPASAPQVPAEPAPPVETASGDTPAPAPSPQPAAPAPAATTPTPEQTAVLADLHWLIHQGHVIEFATGRMETAKKPKPKPPKPEVAQPQPASTTAEAAKAPAEDAAPADASHESENRDPAAAPTTATAVPVAAREESAAE
jgi:hypothetical protein